MATNSALWPSAPIEVSDGVKHLITRFFEISDSTDPSSGELFARELFTKDGSFKTHETLVFRGHDEIAASRKENPRIITSRGHQLAGVYASNTPATDLVVLGKFDIKLVDGNTTSMDFTARFTVALEEEQVKLQFVRVWTDPTDMLAAYKKANDFLAGQ